MPCFSVLQDIPVPAFMTNKEESEWSEDEKKLAQEYEKKVSNATSVSLKVLSCFNLSMFILAIGW